MFSMNLNDKEVLLSIQNLHPWKESDLRRERGRPRPIIHAMQVECGIVTYPPKRKESEGGQGHNILT